MIGCYDFCGHYDWTFEWLCEQGGESLVQEYWSTAIARDSQSHAASLIATKGIAGMKEYWGHTLDHEAAGYSITSTEKVFRIDMHDCPSKGFLLRNGLQHYHDYCDHCVGWIGPMMQDAGFVIDHAHNHCGQCWWEMRQVEDTSVPSSIGEMSGKNDIRLSENWNQPNPVDLFVRANSPKAKEN
jgi:hypothetical protein